MTLEFEYSELKEKLRSATEEIIAYAAEAEREDLVEDIIYEITMSRLIAYQALSDLTINNSTLVSEKGPFDVI